MSAALAIIDDPVPGGLSPIAWGTLQAIAAARGCGVERHKLDGRALRTLERRNLVEERGAPSLTRKPRLFATIFGFDLIRADKLARGVEEAPLRRITPSKRSLWEGTPAPNSRFTAAQVLELDRMRIDHRRVPLVLVAVPVPEDEVYVPAGQPRPTRRYACPRVGLCRRPGLEGRVAVITPSGEWAGVMPDGTDPRPYGQQQRAAAPYGREAFG